MNNTIRVVTKSGKKERIFLSCWLVVIFLITNAGTSLFGETITTNEKGTTYHWTQDTTIDEPFIVYSGETLIIDPGVTVEFTNAYSKIRIEGKIKSVGAASSPISFKSVNGQGARGIELIYADTAIFEYCSFENFNPGVTNDQNNGAIYSAWTDSIAFKSCVFSENQGGIIVINASDLIIDECTFIGNHCLGKERGVVFLKNSSSSSITNNLFINNITNIDGIISVNRNTSANIIGNSFIFNTWDNYGPVIGGYPIIYSRGESGFANNVIINGNTFENNLDFENVLDENAQINEIYLFGEDDEPENSFVFIWNNEFNGSVVQPNTDFNKTAIRSRGVTITASHNSFRNYSKNVCRIQYSNVKLHVNDFEENYTLNGVIRFENYSSYTGEQLIYNEVYSNSFKNNYAKNGGAIWSEIISNEKITLDISSNHFFNNTANGNNAMGGAVYANRNGNLFIEDNVFESNKSDGLGGAVCLRNASENLVISKNIFKSNFAKFDGGALTILQPDSLLLPPVSIEANEFNVNKSNTFGGAIAISSNDILQNNSFNIVGNYFDSDSAVAKGGAMYLKSIGLYADSNTFVTNVSDSGGAIYCHKIIESEFNNNVIYRNSASSGGGVFLDSIGEADQKSNEVMFIDNIIQNNLYTNQGGGIYIKDSYNTRFIRNLIAFNTKNTAALETYGNGMYVDTSSIDIINCNIMNNESAGGGIEPGGAVSFYLSEQNTLNIHNCNVINHPTQGGLFFEEEIDPMKISIQNCLFWGNEEYSIKYPSLINNHEVDPINAEYCYFDNFSNLFGVNVNTISVQLYPLPGWDPDNPLHLNCENSVCIDKGNPAPVYNDVFFPPSCGEDTNDIGISGGHNATDADFLYEPYQRESIQASFTVEIVSNQDRKILIRENSQFTTSALLSGVKYQWYFGDGNYTEKLAYHGNRNIKYDFEDDVEEATILFILDTKLGKRTYCQTVHFSNNSQDTEKATPTIAENLKQQNITSENKIFEQGLNLYPNPTTGKINVVINTLMENPEFRIQVNNLLGEIVFKKTYNDFSTESGASINIENCQPGLYFVRISLGDCFVTKKIVLHK